MSMRDGVGVGDPVWVFVDGRLNEIFVVSHADRMIWFVGRRLLLGVLFHVLLSFFYFD